MDVNSAYQNGWDDGYAEGYACKLADATEPFSPTSARPEEVLAAANYLRKKFKAYFVTDADAIGTARGMLLAISEQKDFRS